MVPMRSSYFILSGVVVGVTVVTLVAWKYMKMKRKYSHTEPLYVAKNICIVNSPEEWEALYRQLKKDKMLGLDCEWVSKQKVALLQLASPSGLCVLVRLFKLKPTFPESLRSLLADNSILKVGVAIADDGRRLYQDYGLRVCGCVDLRHVLKRSRRTFHCTSRGLKGLANGILGVDISKNFNVRCGNWEAETFSKQQVEYAATDAAVAVDIFLCLVFIKMEELATGDKSVKSSRHNPLNSEHPNTPILPSTTQNQQSFNNLANLVAEAGDSSTTEHILSSDVTNHERRNNVCDIGDKDSLEDNTKNTIDPDDKPNTQDKSKNDATDAQDRNGKCKNNYISITGESSIGYLNSTNICGDSRVFPSQMFDELQDDKQKEIYKFARSLCQGIVDSGYINHDNRSGVRLQSRQLEKTKSNAYSFRKRPLWDNCRLQAPDGTLLCTCDQRKAQWYLDKELGDTVCEDPLTVRLRFEPSNRPETERNYYLQEKKNVCVVCGWDKDYVRKFIVPLEYRKYFPSALKDHSSHDVLLLCTQCHRKSCDSDISLRLQLAKECSAPLDSGATCHAYLDHDLQKVRSAGRAMLMNKNSIPKERIIELEKIVQHFYGVDVTEELVKQAANINAKQTTANYMSHGEKVVKHLISNGGLLAFQTRWRQHFLDTMNPEYLPAFWSVDFVQEAWNRRQAIS